MNLINIIFGSLLALGSMFSPAKTQSLGAAVPSIQALFETSLQASVTSNATSATLVSGTDLAGNNIFGYYCFTIDAGTVQNEFVCGNASGTALTNLTRGVNPALGITSNVALEYAHRRGADVKMTDAPYLSIYSNIFNGQQGIPASMYYDAHPTSTASTTIEDKAYIDNSVTAGGVPATTGVPGISPLSTGAQMASGTATTTYNTLTYSYVPANSNFSSVAKGSYVGVVASGTIDPSFLLNGNYSLGSTTVQSLTSASTTLNGTTTVNGAIVGALQLSNGSSSAGTLIAYSGAIGSTTIPSYVNTIQIKALGAGGDGLGGVASGTLAVTGGTTYYYCVGQSITGGNSAGGFCGGGTGSGNYGSYGDGGAGMTWLSTASTFSTSTVIIVGGGAGGGGQSANGCYGGLTTGGNGGSNGGGLGGTQLAGGAGGTYSGATNGNPGSAGQGGSTTGGLGQGGGGGGYFGGGGASGGGSSNGGGGGGSSYLASSLTSTSTATSSNTGNGSLSIYYTGLVLPQVGVIQMANSATNNAITITFTKAFTKTPSCSVIPSTNTQAWVSAESTSSFTFNLATTTANMFVNYQCF